MKLKDWLKKERFKQIEFAKMVEISQPYCNQIVSGSHVPGPEVMARITKVTKGHVKAKDFERDK